MDDPSLVDRLNDYVTASRGVIGLFKDFRSMLPKGQPAEDVTRQIDAAEKALQASEAQLAKALGYHLCQCTYPPQVMLLSGRHPKRGDHIFTCGKCGDQEPSQHYFDERDREDAMVRQINSGSGHWMG